MRKHILGLAFEFLIYLIASLIMNIGVWKSILVLLLVSIGVRISDFISGKRKKDPEELWQVIQNKFKKKK